MCWPSCATASRPGGTAEPHLRCWTVAAEASARLRLGAGQRPALGLVVHAAHGLPDSHPWIAGWPMTGYLRHSSRNSIVSGEAAQFNWELWGVAEMYLWGLK